MLYIVGSSGSGKTTLLSMISWILRPNEGKVSISGRDIWQLRNNAIADFRLNTVSFVFQDYHLFPRLTTAENVNAPSCVCPVRRFMLPMNSATNREIGRW
jgi:putative ABC transport system ATP-binding protein